jgi:hypothetical protein
MADGSNGERKSVTSTLTLTFEHDTFSLHVSGEAPAIDVFMAMIDQAKRHFEAQLRAQAAMQLQQQIADQVRTRGIIDRLGGKA